MFQIWWNGTQWNALHSILSKTLLFILLQFGDILGMGQNKSVFFSHHITKISKQWNNNLIPFCYISSYFIPLTSHYWISKHGFNFFLFFHWNDTFQLKEEGIKPQKGKDGFDVWVPYGACFNSNEYPHRNTSNKLQRSFLNTLSTIDWNLLENMTSS